MIENTMKYFRELSKVPRNSKHEEKAREWFISWAKENSFEYKVDKVGNTLVIVPATEGMEDKETVILQGHIDMVCVKSQSSEHDFTKDEIEILEKDGFIFANETTLGADNGIGLAMAMAAAGLDKHPKLEILATVDEEQGMTGANQLEEKFLNGKMLINLDSEDEGEITIGSAGGARVHIEGNYEIDLSKNTAYDFRFYGIKGGHSGVEIHKSLGNVIDCFFGFLDFLDIDFQLSTVKSGVAENAIPKELEAIVTFSEIDDLEEKIKEYKKYYQKEYNEFNFDIRYEKLDCSVETISLFDSYKIKETILKSKSGVYKKSEELKDFVLTSQNLGIFNLYEGNLDMHYLCRSSIERDLNDLVEYNKKIYGKIAKVSAKDPNPGWLEDINSHLIRTVKTSYDKITGKSTKLLGVHAGLECGAIIRKMPEGSTAVSIGPNIFGAHTIKERCELRSVGVLCNILKDVLENI